VALLPEQKLIASAFGYEPVPVDLADEPADTSLCLKKIELREGWPHIKHRGEWCPVPTMEEVEAWVFDSICLTPDEDEVEPDDPDSWLSILGLI